jgi:hypothetical protein
VVQALEVLAQLGGGATGGGAGVVELVHETGGEGAQGGHFLLLDGHALQSLEARGHVAQDGLADMGAGGHELPERLFVETDEVAGSEGVIADEVGDVGQQRDLPEGGSGAEVELVDDAAVGAGLDHAELALEQDVEELGGLALAVEDLAFDEMDLFKSFQAGELFVFEGGENGDATELGENLRGELVSGLESGSRDGRSQVSCCHC